ncbi:hypothetical protein FJZ40_03950 [Candidatus Shapirobacteria bacterium]|nr:hypothetical protein [Candidatus Shapirobacteria bacterium]
MAQVSKYPLAKIVYDRIFEILFGTIADIKNPKEVEEFFNDFLSPTERIMLAKRLAIGVLLAKGYRYEAIREILRVSQTTVADVSLFLKYAGKGYKRVIEKILAAEKQEEFWQKINDLIGDHLPPPGIDWSYWRKEREAKKRARRKPF